MLSNINFSVLQNSVTAVIGKSGEIIALITFVLGGLFIGWFTPTEAGAAGAFGAIVITLVRRRFSWQIFKDSLFATAKTTGMIYALIIGAFLFNFFLAVSTIPTSLAEFAGRLPLPPLGIIVIIILLYVLLGCFIDALAMILLTIPIFFPLCMNLGYHPIWFGILLVRMTEVGAITPPFGINVFILSGISGVPVGTIYRGVIPFVIADFFHVALIIAIPALSLTIPNMM